MRLLPPERAGHADVRQEIGLRIERRGSRRSSGRTRRSRSDRRRRGPCRRGARCRTSRRRDGCRPAPPRGDSPGAIRPRRDTANPAHRLAVDEDRRIAAEGAQLADGGFTVPARLVGEGHFRRALPRRPVRNSRPPRSACPDSRSANAGSSAATVSVLPLNVTGCSTSFISAAPCRRRTNAGAPRQSIRRRDLELRRHPQASRRPRRTPAHAALRAWLFPAARR